MGRAYLRVVFDTNVLLQALLNPFGPSGRCFHLARERKIQLFISEKTLLEIEEVVARSSFRSLMNENPSEQIERFLYELKLVSYLGNEMPQIFRLDRDPKDEMIIDLAVGCDADHIVTWDRDLLDLMTGTDVESKQFRQRFRHLKIVKPDEFLTLAETMDLSMRP